MRYEFEAELWEYLGQGTWVFVTLPKDMGKEIKELFGNDRRGFGSIKVKVRLGGSQWKTSIFPDSKSGSYVLPIKKEVRGKEKLSVGASARISIETNPS